MKVIVVGGGIAGLSAAYSLAKSSMALDVTVLEAASWWGGKIRTDTSEGFVIEGGPDTFLATKLQGVALCKELGLGERLHGTNPAQCSTYVLHNGKLVPLPDGLAMMIPTNFRSMAATRLLNWLQKIRMGMDFVLPPRPLNGDESLGGFVSRRLGRAAYENLIEPLMSGIYAGDGDMLSLKSTFPYLRDMELNHGGLVKGALDMKVKAARAGKAAQGSRSAFLTPTLGLAEIVEALIEALTRFGTDLRLNTRVTAVEERGPGYALGLADGGCLDADFLILAAPAYASAGLLADLDPALSAELKQIPYTSTATISLAYRQEDLVRPLDGYGYVIPRREGRRALACTWTSTKFPHRAPQGFALLRVFAGRAGQEDQIPWDEASLLEIALEEVRLSLGIKAEPYLSRVFIWEKAMPQYNLGHPDRLARIDACLAQRPNLALAGNGYHGIGVPDCIKSGQTAAEKALQLLQPATHAASA